MIRSWLDVPLEPEAFWVRFWLVAIVVHMLVTLLDDVAQRVVRRVRIRCQRWLLNRVLHTPVRSC